MRNPSSKWKITAQEVSSKSEKPLIEGKEFRVQGSKGSRCSRNQRKQGKQRNHRNEERNLRAKQTTDDQPTKSNPIILRNSSEAKIPLPPKRKGVKCFGNQRNIFRVTTPTQRKNPVIKGIQAKQKFRSPQERNRRTGFPKNGTSPKMKKNQSQAS